jgi:CHAT domain-containing protein
LLLSSEGNHRAGFGRRAVFSSIVGLTLHFVQQDIAATSSAAANESITRLMMTFHQKLRAGMAKDEALRQAMATVRNDPRTAHPYYWAAFFLTGDPDNPNLGQQKHRRS